MHVILIGGGKALYFLAKECMTDGHKVTIINSSPDECRNLSQELQTPVYLGEGSDPKILEEAEAAGADVFLALTAEDHENLVACQVAADKFGVPRTIALVNNPDNDEVFQKLGVSATFSATRIFSNLLREQTGFMAINNLMALAQGRITISELRLPVESPAAGKSLKELMLPESVLIASILREGEILVPRGSSVLQPGDHLIVIVQADKGHEALRLLTGE